jgi:hypothetical protein
MRQSGVRFKIKNHYSLIHGPVAFPINNSGFTSYYRDEHDCIQYIIILHRMVSCTVFTSQAISVNLKLKLHLNFVMLVFFD